MQRFRLVVCGFACLIVGLGTAGSAGAADSPAQAVALTPKDVPSGFKAQTVVNEGMNSFYRRAEYAVTFTGSPQGSPAS